MQRCIAMVGIILLLVWSANCAIAGIPHSYVAYVVAFPWPGGDIRLDLYTDLIFVWRAGRALLVIYDPLVTLAKGWVLIMTCLVACVLGGLGRRSRTL